jgi:hypothetical protein
MKERKKSWWIRSKKKNKFYSNGFLERKVKARFDERIFKSHSLAILHVYLKKLLHL